MESGSQIKYSMGDVRGKNDVVDAQRIARYAYKNRDQIKLYTPLPEPLLTNWITYLTFVTDS